MRVIIAGGRTYDDYKVLKEYCDYILQNQNDIEIVCGCANGADNLGRRYAEEKGYKVTLFPADWNKFGKSAGYRRNVEMGNYADSLIAFWDGESKGTEHMINIAKDKNLKVAVKKYEKVLVDEKKCLYLYRYKQTKK